MLLETFALVCLLVLLLVTGCWDIKDLQTVNYVTSVGLDYKNGKFIIYAQMLDFSSVAKQETGKASHPPSQWVGKGTGETINLAINDLYNAMQQKSLWSHITSIVISNSYLEQETTRMADTFFVFVTYAILHGYMILTNLSTSCLLHQASLI